MISHQSRAPYFLTLENQIRMGPEVVLAIPLRCLSQTLLSHIFKAIKSLIINFTYLFLHVINHILCLWGQESSRVWISNHLRILPLYISSSWISRFYCSYTDDLRAPKYPLTLDIFGILNLDMGLQVIVSPPHPIHVPCYCPSPKNPIGYHAGLLGLSLVWANYGPIMYCGSMTSSLIWA